MLKCLLLKGTFVVSPLSPLPIPPSLPLLRSLPLLLSSLPPSLSPSQMSTAAHARDLHSALVPDLPSDLASLDAKLRGASDVANHGSSFSLPVDGLTHASLDSLKAAGLDLSSDALAGGFGGLFGTASLTGTDSIASFLDGVSKGGAGVDLKGMAGKGEGGMDAEGRIARVNRYREKRKNRKFEKTIRYASRKAYAESRPRVKVSSRTRKGMRIECT